MRLLSAAVTAVLLSACASSIAKDARRPSAVACADKPLEQRSSCFSALPKLTADEPATCAYWSDSRGWISPQPSLFGSPKTAATEQRLKAYAWNHLPPVGDLQAASGACLVAMSEELAAAAKASAEQEDDARARKAAEEQKQREEIETRRLEGARDRVEKTVLACKAKWSSDASACKSPLLNDAEIADCSQKCAEGAATSVSDALAAAKKACLDGWGSKGSKSECAIAKPDGANVDDAKLGAAVADCTAECKKDGPAAQKERATAERVAAERSRVLDAYGQCMERGMGAMKLSFAESRKRCLVLSRCETLESKQPGACTSARDPRAAP